MEIKTIISKGDTFRGRTIEKQLDRGLNPWRHVYKCGKEVLVVFYNSLIPESFLVESVQGKVPVEYKYIIDSLEEMRSPTFEKEKLLEYPRFGSFSLFGLPKIHETGQDAIYTWIIEDYISGEPLSEYIQKWHYNGCDPINSNDYAELTSLFSSVCVCLSYFELTGRPNNRICITPRSIIVQENADDIQVAAGLLMGDMFCPSQDYRDYPNSYDLRFLPEDNVITDHSIVASLGLCFLSLVNGGFPFKTVPRLECKDTIWRMIRDSASSVFVMGFNPQHAKMLYRCLLKPYLRPYYFTDVFDRDDDSVSFSSATISFDFLNLIRNYSQNAELAFGITRQCYQQAILLLLKQPKVSAIRSICEEVESLMLELDMKGHKEKYDCIVEAVCLLFISICEALSDIDLLYEPSPKEIATLMATLPLQSLEGKCAANILLMSSLYLYGMGIRIYNLLQLSRVETLYYNDTVSKVYSFMQGALDMLRLIPGDVFDTSNQQKCCSNFIDDLTTAIIRATQDANDKPAADINTELIFPEYDYLKAITTFVGLYG